MTDLTIIFKDLCNKSKHGGASTINTNNNKKSNKSDTECVDDKGKNVGLKYYFEPSQCEDRYLREAYRINEHIEQLRFQLEKIRPAYLNVSRRTKNSRNLEGKDTLVHMTDKERDELDAQAKTVLNRCLQAIFNLENIEKERLEALARRRPLTALGRILPESWLGSQAADPEWLNEVRGAITWLLNKKAMSISELQKQLQHARLSRELDRQEIFSWKSSQPVSTQNKSSEAQTKESFHLPWNLASQSSDNLTPPPLRVPEEEVEDYQLSPEQLHVLQKENDALLEQFESSLQQVKQAEKSLLEISNMQTTLSTHIALQAREAERLYQDAQDSSEALGQGNQYLKSATSNAAQSRYFLLVFFLVASATLLFLDWYG